MKKLSRKQIIQGNEISEVREYFLGGYNQKILIEGKSRNNPIVICLHGGPGSPIPFSVGCRGLFPDITDNVIMVCWDQLGCGINNRPIDDNFAIKNYVEMTADLVKEIRAEFKDNKLILLGVSWGSILALKAIEKVGDLIDSVVTYGQVLCDITFNEEVYSALEKGAMPQKNKKELQEIKGVRTLDNTKKLMSWIGKYTEGYQCKESEKAPIGDIILGLLTSPDYKFKDFKAIVVNGCMKNTSLINELIRLDLREELAKVSIPYTIIQGNTDIVTSTSTIRAFVEKENNPNINFVCVENSGHMPGKHAIDIIMKEVIGYEVV